MTVCIVHYHLQTGGVAQVITTASRVLAQSGIAHVILVGNEPAKLPADLPLRVVPGLGYGDHGNATLHDDLRAAASDALGQAPDVWHFHNHSLGKNPWLAPTVARLAEDGERLILQLHDLAEDGRPHNYQNLAGCSRPYPFSPRIHYAFLNTRDRDTFLKAGLPEENATVIVNPIPLPAGKTTNQSGPPIVFAPVRGIRRKNLGELVFLSALAPEGTRFAMSRAPLDEEALALHDTWSRFTQRQALPIMFDVVDRFTPAAGADASFESWLAHATHFASTSVSEGFGLPFLEAIAHRRPLLGRKIPHIAADHAHHGIHAGQLYDQLLVPTEWVDLNILREHLTTTLERHYRAYGRRLIQETINRTFDLLLHDGRLDFGNLPEHLQQGIIERIADPDCRQVPLVSINGKTQSAATWLPETLTIRTPSATTDQLAPFSPTSYGQDISALYARLANAAADKPRFVSPERILTSHLAPESFLFLCSPPPPSSSPARIRAVIFDIYGTLLSAAAGGVKPDPFADPILREILRENGFDPPSSPSTELHNAVLRHHAAKGLAFPEVDLRTLWREILHPDESTDMTALVIALEQSWHPASPIPGALQAVRRLSRSGLSLGLLSNAQSNTLHALGDIANLFAPELSILSYQHGIAKPSPALFEILTERLAGRSITPSETLFIGNDPLQDIAPAAAHGFKTALFTGHSNSHREGHCTPDFIIRHWSEIAADGSCIGPENSGPK
jgi:FMN phosphatase YigB (HAD superfamily)